MKRPVELRKRLWLIGACVVVVALGLASRSTQLPLPVLISRFAGDTLWAVLVFLLLAIVRPGKSTLWLAGTALTIAFAVEFLQLYQAPWLNSIRSTLPGRLVLGQGFLFSDLLCYTIGISVAAALYQAITERTRRDLPTISGVATLILVVVSTFACNFGAGDQVLPIVNRLPGRDKTGHFLLSGALTFSMILMLVPRLKISPVKIAAALAILVTLEECSQHLMNTRTFSVADLACSLGGIVLLGSLAMLFTRAQAAE